MPAGIPSSGSCEVELGARATCDCCIFVVCYTHEWSSENVTTPAEAWAWEQQHRREVAAEGEIPRVGTLVEPDVAG